MRQITLRIPERTLDELEEEAEERGVSRSEHIRDILDDRHEADELRREIDRLEARLREQERRERERASLENRVDELAIEVREPRDRRPWPLGWIDDVRETLGSGDQD